MESRNIGVRKHIVYYCATLILMGLPLSLSWQRICQQCRRPGFDPRVGKIIWKRKWQPTPVFLPGESHGLRSLAHYSPWGRKELGMTEWQSTAVSPHTIHFQASDKTHFLALEGVPLPKTMWVLSANPSFSWSCYSHCGEGGTGKQGKRQILDDILEPPHQHLINSRHY